MKIKNVVMGIGIIILTIFVVVYGFSTFYSRVEYSDYCPEYKVGLDYNETICLAEGGVWYPEGIVWGEDGGATRVAKTERCDLGDIRETCNKEYREAREKRAKIIFVIAIPLAILIIALGAMLFSLESVGAGLMGGGIGTLIYGAGGYWEYAEDWIRFLSSVIGLVVLIWFAYWWNKKSSENN